MNELGEGAPSSSLYRRWGRYNLPGLCPLLGRRPHLGFGGGAPHGALIWPPLALGLAPPPNGLPTGGPLGVSLYIKIHLIFNSIN